MCSVDCCEGPEKIHLLPQETVSIAVSPDEKYIITGHEEGVLCLWDKGVPHRLTDANPGISKIHPVAFSRDGKRFVDGCDGVIRVWKTRNLKVIQKLNKPSFMRKKLRCIIYSIAFSNSREYIACSLTIFDDRNPYDAVQMWKANRNGVYKLIYTMPIFRYTSCDHTVSFGSNDACYFITANNNLYKYKIDTGDLISTMKHPDSVYTFAASNGLVITLCEDYMYRVITEDANVLHKLQTNRDVFYHCVCAISPCADSIVTATSIGELYIRDTKTGQETKRIITLDMNVRFVNYTPTGRKLVAVDISNNTLLIWNLI